MKERGMEPDKTIAQLGIDDGQGLLKIMLSIKHVDETSGERRRKNPSILRDLVLKISKCPVQKNSSLCWLLLPQSDKTTSVLSLLCSTLKP